MWVIFQQMLGAASAIADGFVLCAHLNPGVSALCLSPGDGFEQGCPKSPSASATLCGFVRRSVSPRPLRISVLPVLSQI